MPDSGNTENWSKGPSWGSGARAWLPVFLGALFVLGCAAVFSWLLRPRPESTIVQPDGTVAVAKDAFGRSSDDGLGSATGGHRWEVWSGGWAVSAGVAHVVQPESTGSYAVLAVGDDASITAKVGGLAECGIVASASTEERTIELVKVPVAKVVELRSRSGDVVQVLDTIPMPKQLASVLTLRLERGVITASVGGVNTSVVMDDPPGGAFAGLLAEGPNQTRCTFDDVVVFHPGE